MSTETENKLSPEQIENWRNVLVSFVGPYALIMPEEQINEFRDRFQSKIDKLDQGYQESKCPFEVGDTVKVTGKGKGTVLECYSNQILVKWSYGGRSRVNVNQAEKVT